MSAQKIERLVILGGGTAGWMTAALLSRVLSPRLKVTLVESQAIGTVGVGEATIPPIVTLNQALGIDQADLMRKTQATIKLGIQFRDWRRLGHSYMHAFGALGRDIPFCEFFQLWLRTLKGSDAASLWEYSLNYQAAMHGKFALLNKIPKTDMGGLSYAFHLDAGLYAKYLQEVSLKAGVKRVEGVVEEVIRSSTSGHILELRLKGKESVAGDLFVDCSGFRSLLLGEGLGVEFEDWRHWLPCDRALTVRSERESPPKPYTESVAHTAGWRWRIPLQSHTGNGVVFSSEHLSEEAAREELQQGSGSNAEPRLIQFRAGRRAVAWKANCVGIGLAAGFLEPLESTSIHMIQSAAIRLLKLFPNAGINASEVDEFNRQSQEEAESIRDFIVLHYRATERDDSTFWRERKQMQVPATLQNKLSLFEETGKIFTAEDALFSNVAWQQVMMGQGIIPKDHHPLADAMSDAQLSEYTNTVKTIVSQVVGKLPSHAEFLAKLNS